VTNENGPLFSSKKKATTIDRFTGRKYKKNGFAVPPKQPNCPTQKAMQIFGPCGE